MYYILKPIIYLIIKILFRPEIIGNKNIPTNGPIILAGNHTNYLDSLLLIAISKRKVHFLAKKELFKWYSLCFLKSMGAIPVERRKKDIKCRKEAINILKKGKVLGIFPEGTINRKKETTILPFKYGAVHFSHCTKATIVPFAITGKYNIINGRLKIEFGKSFIANENLEQSNNKLEQKVIKLIEANR